MNVLTVAGLLVAAAIFVAILVAAHRGRRGSGHDSAPEPPPGGTTFGAVPGYMPGMGRRVEHHDVVTSARVDPPRPEDGAATVDLDGNVARVRSAEQPVAGSPDAPVGRG